MRREGSRDVPVTDGGVPVEWETPVSPRLRDAGVPRPVADRADVVVVDRRSGDTTPEAPGEMTLHGRRVVVLPESDARGPPVELRVAGGPEAFGRVVDTLRRTVVFDARVSAEFESARRHTAAADEAAATPATLSAAAVARRFDHAETPLAVGGFAGAVRPLPCGNAPGR